MLRRLSERDYYEVLEVAYDASPEEIQNAYEEAREMYTHDALVSGSILSDQERRRTYECITAAYQTLIAEDSRRMYDEMIGVPSARKTKAMSKPQAEAVVAPSPRAPESPASPAANASDVSESGSPVGVEPTVSGSLQQSMEGEAHEAPAAPDVRASRPAALELGAAEEATGEFLRRAREAMGLDLGTISQETKIGRSMLEYIEEERLDRLPAPVYLKNFTLQMAQCLGLDEERVARTYLARIRRLQAQPRS